MELEIGASTNYSAKEGFNASEPGESSNFPSESLAFKIFKLFCYSLVFLLGIVGNALVFRMVTKRRKLRTVSNIFICNLAAADIAVLAVNLPFRLAYQENSYIWPFGTFLCKIVPMLMYLFITASSATLVVMTLDKHRAIVYPLRRRFTIKKTKIAIVCIWVFSALITLPFNFALKVVVKKGRPVCTDVWPSLEFERFYFVCLFVVQFVIPMTIITTCYTMICTHLNSASPSLDHLTSMKHRTDRNRKVIKMLVVIAAVYAVFTLPYHVTWLFSVFGYPNSVAKKLCVLVVIATSAAHPIIYGTLNKEFAKGFTAYVPCYRRLLKKRKTYKMETKSRGRTGMSTTVTCTAILPPARRRQRETGERRNTCVAIEDRASGRKQNGMMIYERVSCL